MRIARVLLPAILATAQAGLCVETDNQPDALANSTWTLTEIGDRKALEQPAVTLEFRTPGQIAGNGGCNRFGGGCRFDDHFIHISRLRATRRACEEEVMEQEKRFLRLLGDAVTWEVTEDGTLVLGGPEGEIHARRQPGEAADAAGQ